jgi:hypothetical protein
VRWCFGLRLNVLQHCIEMAGTDRESAVSALPEKPAISTVERFDPFRRPFLYLFDQLRLRNSPRQCRDDVNVIRNTAYMNQVSAEMTADCRQICMYSRPQV